MVTSLNSLVCIILLLLKWASCPRGEAGQLFCTWVHLVCTCYGEIYVLPFCLYLVASGCNFLSCYTPHPFLTPNRQDGVWALWNEVVLGDTWILQPVRCSHVSWEEGQRRPKVEGVTGVDSITSVY